MYSRSGRLKIKERDNPWVQKTRCTGGDKERGHLPTGTRTRTPFRCQLIGNRLQSIFTCCLGLSEQLPNPGCVLLRGRKQSRQQRGRETRFFVRLMWMLFFSFTSTLDRSATFSLLPLSLSPLGMSAFASDQCQTVNDLPPPSHLPLAISAGDRKRHLTGDQQSELVPSRFLANEKSTPSVLRT